MTGGKQGKAAGNRKKSGNEKEKNRIIIKTMIYLIQDSLVLKSTRDISSLL